MGRYLAFAEVGTPRCSGLVHKVGRASCRSWLVLASAVVVGQRHFGEGKMRIDCLEQVPREAEHSAALDAAVVGDNLHQLQLQHSRYCSHSYSAVGSCHKKVEAAGGTLEIGPPRLAGNTLERSL